MLATKPMNQPLTQARVLRFYLPLVVNSVLMTIEIPVVTAGVSRLPDAEVNLAGLSIIVALSFTLTNLGVPLTHTGNALGRSLQAFKLLRLFSLGVCGVMALISASIYFTPLYTTVVQGLLGVPEYVATSTRSGVQMMIVAGFAIAWRRFYHGVLIRHGYTSVVGWITMIRATTLLSITIAGVTLGSLTGIQVAGLALAGSATVECVVVNIVAEAIIRRPKAIRWESDQVFAITYGAALRFFLPLSLVLVLGNSVRPIITASMTRLPDPVLSLAAFPVAYGVFNVVFSPLWVLTQTRDCPGQGRPILPRRRRLRASRVFDRLAVLVWRHLYPGNGAVPGGCTPRAGGRPRRGPAGNSYYVILFTLRGRADALSGAARGSAPHGLHSDRILGEYAGGRNGAGAGGILGGIAGSSARRRWPT